MMEGKGIGLDKIPGFVITRLGVIRTCVAVSPDGQAGCRLKRGKQPTDKGIGNVVEDLPASVSFVNLGVKGVAFLVRKKTDQVLNTASQAQIHTAVKIEFNVYVAGVTRHRAEEKFQAAVTAGGI